MNQKGFTVRFLKGRIRTEVRIPFGDGVYSFGPPPPGYVEICRIKGFYYRIPGFAGNQILPSSSIELERFYNC